MDDHHAVRRATRRALSSNSHPKQRQLHRNVISPRPTIPQNNNDNEIEHEDGMLGTTDSILPSLPSMTSDYRRSQQQGSPTRSQSFSITSSRRFSHLSASGVNNNTETADLERLVDMLRAQVQEKSNKLSEYANERDNLQDQLDEACRVYRDTNNSQRENTELKTAVQSKQNKLEQTTRRLEQEQERTAHLTQRLEQLQSQLSGVRTDEENENRDLKVKLKSLEELIESMKTSLDGAQKRVEEAQSSAHRLKHDANKYRKASAKASKDLHDASVAAALVARKHAHELENLRKELVHESEINAALELKIKNIQHQFDHKNSIIKARQNKVTDLEGQIRMHSIVDEELVHLKEEATKRSIETEALHEQVFSLRSSLGEQSARHQVADSEIAELRGQLGAFKHKADAAAARVAGADAKARDAVSRAEKIQKESQFAIVEAEKSAKNVAKLEAEMQKQEKLIVTLKEQEKQLRIKCEAEDQLKMKAQKDMNEVLEVAKCKTKKAELLAKETRELLRSQERAHKRQVSDLEKLLESTEVRAKEQAKLVDKVTKELQSSKTIQLQSDEQVKQLNRVVQAHESEIVEFKIEIEQLKKKLLHEASENDEHSSKYSETGSKVNTLERELATKQRDCDTLKAELKRVQKLRDDDQVHVTDKINAAKAQVVRLKRLEQELLKIKEQAELGQQEQDEQDAEHGRVNVAQAADMATELVRLQAKTVALERQNNAMRVALQTNPEAVVQLQETRANNRKGKKSF